MVVEVSFEALRRVQLEEKRSPALTQLTDDFYARYGALLRDQQTLLRKDFSLEAASVYESTRRVLRDVWERRQQKIAVKALGDARAKEMRAEGLASEEQRLYNALHTLYQEGDTAFAHGLGTAPEQNGTAAEPEKTSEDMTRVQIVSDLPAFVGPDGKSHGPFRAEDVVELPRTVASLLEKRGAAKPHAERALAPSVN